MTKRLREDEVAELDLEEQRPSKEARAESSTLTPLNSIMEDASDAVLKTLIPNVAEKSEKSENLSEIALEDAPVSQLTTEEVPDQNAGEVLADDTLAEIPVIAVKNQTLADDEEEEDDDDDDDDDKDAEFHTTDETFKEFSMDVLDYMWPKTQHDSITTPDGVQQPWSTFLEMAEIMRGEKVEVIVGQSKTRFLISEDLLCRSPYFRAVFQGKFQESTSRRSVLPDIDPYSFKFITEAMLLGRFNHAKIPKYTELRSTGQPHTTVENRTTINIWLNLIYVADQLQLDNLREGAETTVEGLLKRDREFIEAKFKEERQTRRPIVSVPGAAALPQFPRNRRRGYLRPETIIEVFDKAPHNSRLQDIVKASVFHAIRSRWVKVEKYNDFLMENPAVAIEWMTKMQRPTQEEEDRQREIFLERLALSSIRRA